MKKLFSLMLVLSMACLMLFATAEGMEILGEWHLTVANFDGSDINPMDIGIKGVYCFFEDSTFIFSAEVA